MQVDVVLPCLDEAPALAKLLRAVPVALRPIVVDNGSADGSADLARELGARVVHEPRRGYGAACHRGLMAATAEVVAFCDADASVDLEDLLGLAARLSDGDADLVIGRRVAAPQAWPAHARLANAVLSLPMSLAARHRLHDLGPVRVARRDDLIALGVRDRRSGYPLETVLRAARAGWRIREAPIAYVPRLGRSKVTGTARGTLQAVVDMTRVLAVDGWVR
jgi:glycosyltransferase involved in cell wall biosynthesis